MKETKNLESNTIYIRRGTKCEKANNQEIEKMLEAKIQTIFKDTSELSLEEHLHQLKILYTELPKKIKILVRKGQLNPNIISSLEILGNNLGNISSLFGEPDQYEEVDNPEFPTESYEAFIKRMIEI